MKLKVSIKEKAFERAVLKKNLSYKEIAKELGVTSVYLSNLKNETTPEFRPSANIRRRLMEILDVPFDKIFKIEDSNGKIAK